MIIRKVLSRCGAMSLLLNLETRSPAQITVLRFDDGQNAIEILGVVTSGKRSVLIFQNFQKHMKNIVETAVEAGSFNTLATALTAAGLIETLSGEGPFTVFAPTDDAFAKIPAETLAAVLADKEKLTAILTYHVVAGKVMAADVVKLTSATTVQGSDVAIDAADGVKVNDANIVTADVEATNGVIHVIDTVLMPA
jgi:uncharacterized surface protein with fasciclin (FAS1) repeats